MRTLRSAILSLVLCLTLCAACAPHHSTKPHAPLAKPASPNLSSPLTCPKQQGKRVARDFTDIDLDHNGSASQAEFFCLIDRVFQLLDSDHNQRLNPKEGATTPWLQRADRNRKDGISYKEFRQAAGDAFANADQDKSSSLSAEEFQKSFMWTLP